MAEEPKSPMHTLESATEEGFHAQSQDSLKWQGWWTGWEVNMKGDESLAVRIQFLKVQNILMWDNHRCWNSRLWAFPSRVNGACCHTQGGVLSPLPGQACEAGEEGGLPRCWLEMACTAQAYRRRLCNCWGTATLQHVASSPTQLLQWIPLTENSCTERRWSSTTGMQGPGRPRSPLLGKALGNR